MNGQPITIILSDEAKAFIKLQPFKAQQKIYFNIFKVEGGVMDRELFKKLVGCLCDCNSRNSEENSGKGDRKG